MRSGLGLTALGLAIGIVVSLGLTRLLTSLLFNVKPYDPTALTIAALLLAGVAFAATFIPAVRAARVDPMIALRYE
jgi:ABC-type antimicrobial peptide transport system permease subunit